MMSKVQDCLFTSLPEEEKWAQRDSRCCLFVFWLYRCISTNAALFCISSHLASSASPSGSAALFSALAWWDLLGHFQLCQPPEEAAASEKAPECRTEALTLRLSKNTTSLCASKEEGAVKPPQRSGSERQDGPRAVFRHLQGSVNVPVMGLGFKKALIHQPSVSLLPFGYRDPLRHKAPADFYTSLQPRCNTAPFTSCLFCNFLKLEEQGWTSLSFFKKMEFCLLQPH